MRPNSRSPFDRLRQALTNGSGRARRLVQNTARPYHGTEPPEDASELLQQSFLHRLERLNLMTRGVVAQGLAGEHRSRRRASSVEFADFRKYVPGDDFRQIDWNAFARLDGLFLRQTEAKEDMTVHLLVDCSESMNWGQPSKLGFARRLAAALGFMALSRFDSVTAACFAESLSARLPLVRGKAQILRLLTYLDRAEVGGVTHLERAVREYCAGPVRGGVAFLISDLLSEDDWQRAVVRLLAEGIEVEVIHVLAPQELHPAVDGEIELFDSETGDVVEMVVGEEARHAYEQRVEDWCSSIQDFCHRSEVGYLRLDSALSLEEIFLNQMRRRRIVQ
ncbi:MAG TPA: DUF58 domain-containing protein [Chloroflexota bacterium]|nr:DUF58 domain-containing protein [Chloroflexota bacterium]